MKSKLNKFLLLIKTKGIVYSFVFLIIYLLRRVLFTNLLKFRIFRLINYKFNSDYKSFKIYNNLNRSSTFVDIGANIGKVAEYIYDNYSCEIYCYEPNPAAYQYLKKKFQNINKIKVFNLAIANDNKKRSLYLHKDNKNSENNLSLSQASSLSRYKNNVDFEKSIKVDCISIQKLLDQFIFIDTLKIDIEGYEYEIADTIIKHKHKISKITCELHKNTNYFRSSNALDKLSFL